jgi:hypothetical protein
MRDDERDAVRSLKEGVGAGLIAGVVLLAAQVVVAALLGSSPLAPIQLAASLALGPAAFELVHPSTAIIVGGFAHLALSGFFGLIYGIYNSALTPRFRASLGREAALGAGFGLALWLINFQVLARLHAPWFLDARPGLHLALLALAYGLPLGVIYATWERRAVASGAPASSVSARPVGRA